MNWLKPTEPASETAVPVGFVRATTYRIVLPGLPVVGCDTIEVVNTDRGEVGKTVAVAASPGENALTNTPLASSGWVPSVTHPGTDGSITAASSVPPLFGRVTCTVSDP